MKKWNNPEIELVELSETANVDKYTGTYDDQWAQDEDGQWYLLNGES